MKKQLYSVLIIILSLSFIMACEGKDDGPQEPTAQELTYEKLAGQWSLPSSGGIMVDGVDRTLNYQGFNLSFTEGGYNTTNAGDLFKASGTWEWGNETATQVVLDDGKIVDISSLAASRFVFNFTKSDGPVRAGLAGNYVITVEK